MATMPKKFNKEDMLEAWFKLEEEKTPGFIKDVERRYMEWKKGLKLFPKQVNIRKKRKITQKKLQKVSGIDQSDISKIERGAVKNLTFLKFFKYLDAIGVDIDFSITNKKQYGKIITTE